MTKCLLHMSRIFMIMFSLVFFTNSKRQTSSPTWQPKRVVFQALRYVTRHGEHLIRTAFETCDGLLGGITNRVYGRVFGKGKSWSMFWWKKGWQESMWFVRSIFADVFLFCIVYRNFRVAIASLHHSKLNVTTWHLFHTHFVTEA